MSPQPAKKPRARRRDDAAPALTYAYCLVRGPRPPALGSAPVGLEGAGPPRAIAFGDDLWLVAADAPLARYAGEVIDGRLQDFEWVAARAMEHEAVVEHLLGMPAVVPLKLFTLFAGDRSALAHLRRRGKEIAAALDRVAGRVEWGVRVRRRAGAPPVSARDPRRRAATGRDFLAGKRAARQAARSAAARARAAAESVYAELHGRAVESRRIPPAVEGSGLLLDAAFLVARADGESFAAAAERAAAGVAHAGCELALTGPWPAYHFVESEG
jgi:gas vesicle protein GvpL/GvpF